MTAAESCTGGLISKYMTDIPGSSDVFWGGIISYSNESKEKLLFVDREILNNAGAVSKETVMAMAKGALAVSNTDCSVAVSGVAGPDGGSADKPVGTVWICAALRNGSVDTEKFLYSGDRKTVREETADSALMMVYHLILDNKLLTVEK